MIAGFVLQPSLCVKGYRFRCQRAAGAVSARKGSLGAHTSARCALEILHHSLLLLWRWSVSHCATDTAAGGQKRKCSLKRVLLSESQHPRTAFAPTMGGYLELWCTRTHNGTHRHRMARYGTHTAHNGTQWHRYGTQWHTYCTQWHTTAHNGMQWHAMAHNGTQWHAMAYTVAHNGTQWHTIARNWHTNGPSAQARDCFQLAAGNSWNRLDFLGA